MESWGLQECLGWLHEGDQQWTSDAMNPLREQNLYLGKMIEVSANNTYENILPHYGGQCHFFLIIFLFTFQDPT